MLTAIITFCFYLLFFLTPLVWLPLNYELFEYNKMIFVYLLAVVITGSWLIKMISEQRLILKRTPLDIPLLLFFAANCLSTIFSIDPHTSVYGYYSRSNGGLLSLIAYLLLYFAFVSNFSKEDVFRFLKVALWGGMVAALWAVPEHFGVSPSCALLGGGFNASCWVQNVQARVFSTLGQPNWLAAYIAMLIFPAIYFFLQSKTKSQFSLFYFVLITFYLAFTFTYSRGGTLGLLAGFMIFIALFLFSLFKGKQSKSFKANFKPFAIILGSFLVINLLFGSALFRFKLFIQSSPPPTSNVAISQLESGGSESGQIRLVVWKGAIELFKHYPILGSGLETFAYSYYNFRPKEHNLLSEWDFLYNKAHNEFLNYLATTGIVGFSTYMLIILVFIIWSIKQMYNLQFTIYKEKQNYTLYILNSTLLASYISYLVQNIFGFSVVIIAVFFFLFPAFTFTAIGATYDLKLSKKLSILSHLLNATIYKRTIYLRMLRLLVIFTMAYLVLFIIKLWVADTYFAKGTSYMESGNAGQAYNKISVASQLNPDEPFYQNELGFAAASSAVALKDEDATLSAKLRDEALIYTEQSLNRSPKNVSFYRTAVRTYYELSTLDPKFNEKTIDTMNKAIMLAPTDAKLYYNKGLILSAQNKLDEAIVSLKQAIDLKPNLKEAQFTLGTFYEQKKDFAQAIKQMKIVLKLVPDDPEALKKLKELEKK